MHMRRTTFIKLDSVMEPESDSGSSSAENLEHTLYGGGHGSSAGAMFGEDSSYSSASTLSLVDAIVSLITV